jgi:hypothetical protein
MLLVVSLVLLVVARVLLSEEIVNSCDAVLCISHFVASAACLITVSAH